MSKRWVNREKYVIGKVLKLRRSKGSGSGWLEKEDGEDDGIIAQLKSTDGKALAVKRQDVIDLMYHAVVSHKLPVFVLDFVPDMLLVAMRPTDVVKIAKQVEGRWDDNGNDNEDQG